MMSKVAIIGAGQFGIYKTVFERFVRNTMYGGKFLLSDGTYHVEIGKNETVCRSDY